MKNLLTPENLLYLIASLFGTSVISNFWMNYKVSHLEETIREQLKGNLSETAEMIAEARDDILTVDSEMVTHDELEERAKSIMSELDSDTQSAIEKFMSDTGARVNSISDRVMGMEGKLSKGMSNLSKRTPKSTPPPKTWKGVTQQDRDRCSEFPERCDLFAFNWQSPFRVNGRTIARFSSPNLWAGEGDIDFNLAFKVIAINYGEDPESGAVQNQGVHVLGGYVSEEGKFVPIPSLKSTLLKGDANLDSRLFYTPPTLRRKPFKLFEPSLLVGTTYQHGEYGLSIGGSFLNFRDGEYRVGGNGIITESNAYVGLMGSWHPYILGKNLNIAPSFGWVLGTDSSNTWSVGLQFQVW
jgi:hypothetical protein